MREQEVDLLVRTAWGEARGESIEGMRAVMHTIKNRADRGGWWGNSIAEVVKKPYQYSAWNKDDHNRQVMESMDLSDPKYETIKIMAKLILRGESIDPTNGATHYHTRQVSPPWKDNSKITTRIGNHIFYKDIA